MLGVDIKTNGIVSGLPMLSRYLGGIFHSLIADWLQKRNALTVVWIRRIFNSVSQFAPAVAMLVRVAPMALRASGLDLIHRRHYDFSQNEVSQNDFS